MGAFDGIATFGGGVQDSLENLILRKMREADQRHRFATDAAHLQIEKQRADDEGAYHRESLASLEDQRQATAALRAQQGAARIAGALAPGSLVNPDTKAALEAGDLGNLIQHKDATLASRNITGRLMPMGPKAAPSVGQLASTANPGQDAKDVYTGTADQLQAAEDRKTRAAEQEAARAEREQARTQSAADRADLVRLTASLRPAGQTHGRFTTTQGTDANNKPVMIRTNVDTGEVTVLPVPDGTNFAKREQPATQDQTNLGLYANRVEQSDPLLTKLQPVIQKMNPVTFKAETFLDTPYLQDKNVQSYQQAARNFINSVLRRESGAAISQAEFAEARKQYLPVPGDSDEVLKQKAQNRQIVLENFKRGAGPAYRPLSGASGGTGASPAGGDAAAKAAELLKKYGGG